MVVDNEWCSMSMKPSPTLATINPHPFDLLCIAKNFIDKYINIHDHDIQVIVCLLTLLRLLLIPHPFEHPCFHQSDHPIWGLAFNLDECLDATIPLSSYQWDFKKMVNIPLYSRYGSTSFSIYQDRHRIFNRIWMDVKNFQFKRIVKVWYAYH